MRRTMPGCELTRRALVAGAAAAVIGASRIASAQQPAPRVKGPLVWLDLDQKELDDAYDQSVYAPNQRQITGRYVTNSEGVRARYGAPKRLAYGSTPIEGLDLYAAKTPNAPVQVFIHGGAWRAGPAKDSPPPAEMFVDAGAHSPSSTSTTSSRPTATSCRWRARCAV